MFRQTDEPIDELLATSHGVRTRVQCWRGSTFLGTAPLLSGEFSEAADQLVSGVLDVDVAAVDDTGASWVPTAPTDALNVFGSRLSLTYDLQRASGEWLSVGLGWFIVDEWEAPTGVVNVSAVDVRDVLRTARLLAPSAPAAGGTFVSELRRLVGGRLPVDVTGAPADRTVPSGMAWEESRADAIDELLTAWPARAELDATGTLVILPENITASTPADVTLTEGTGGTVVYASRSGSRDGLYNVVVTRGEDSSTTTAAPVTGYAADTDSDSPTDVNGPMGELVTFFASPLLRTRAQADAAAATILARSLRTAEIVPVTCLPDPRIGVNTRVDLTRLDGSTVTGIVLTSKLPLTGEGGAQQLTLGVLRA